MLIDDFLPVYDVVERHSTIVRASAATTYSAIRTADLAGAAPVKLLLAIRKLPSALVSGPTGLSTLRDRARDRIALGDFEKSGFTVLAEDPPRELLIGLVGAFWTPSGGLSECAPERIVRRSMIITFLSLKASPPGSAVKTPTSIRSASVASVFPPRESTLIFFASIGTVTSHLPSSR